MRTPRFVLVSLAAAGVVSLSACFPMPPAVAPEATLVPESTQSTDAGGYDYTIDDGAGDTWSFSVTNLEENPPMRMGAASAGHRLVAVVLDGLHDEGVTAFHHCFDIAIIGDDGERYLFSETFASLTAENDVFRLGVVMEGESFSGARAVVELPDDVRPDRIEVISSYGEDVAEIDVQ